MSDSNVVIRVEGLGKKYTIHHEQGERYTALRDVVARQAKATGRLLNPFTLAGQLRKAQRQAALEQAESEEEFWALKDVSFEIRRGQRVGIIGRNGAGKSTLLKILSRITEPTTGRVEIRGRVASLLEVGTGFHPELTGRENIYLNGAIMGMTRREISAKYDEIVSFAEVERFLDTPVKRYSSGMYVRLAFAVAANLEPEILVVDEVLAVGDANFQKKCLGKMEEAAYHDGRTVLFVSHNLDAIKLLCGECIWLRNGALAKISPVEDCLQAYVSSSEKGQDEQNPAKLDVDRARQIALNVFVGFRDKSLNLKRTFSSQEPVTLFASFYQSNLPVGSLVNFHIKNSTGSTVFCSISNQPFNAGHIGGDLEVSLIIPPLLLNSGKYYISMYVSSFCPTEIHASWDDAMSFHVDQNIPFALHQGFNRRLPGEIVLNNPHWRIKHIDTPPTYGKFQQSN